MKRPIDTVMLDSGGPVLASTVVCCSCGMPMPPNQTMRCAQCLKAEVSIIEGIPRQIAIPHCRNCGRYNRPPWTKCELESRELLGVCLKRIKGIGKEVRLVDASFIWTEEHSKRIRVKITVQKEVDNSSVLQQTMVVEFTVVNQQCEECQKSFTPHAWTAIVQVRQKVEHRRTFCYLEQLILKSDAHDKVVSLKETREGLDFHFAQRSHAQRFADFVAGCVPAKFKLSRKLISHDANSNEYNFKYTIMLTLCPICVDDVVNIPRGVDARLSGAPPIMLCHKVSNGVRLVDPVTCNSRDIPSSEYWKRPLGNPVCTRTHLREYVVLNVEPVEEAHYGTPARHRLSGRSRMALADIEVARVQDLGVNDERHIVRSHLGATLRAGNHVLGYDLRAVNMSGLDAGGAEAQIADIILIRKFYKRNRHKRGWKVKRLQRDNTDVAPAEVVDDAADMEAMMQDLEEDPELRKGVNMYVAPVGKPAASASNARTADEAEDEDDGEDAEDEDAPEVPLAELLEALELGDDDDRVLPGLAAPRPTGQ